MLYISLELTIWGYRIQKEMDRLPLWTMKCVSLRIALLNARNWNFLEFAEIEREYDWLNLNVFTLKTLATDWMEYGNRTIILDMTRDRRTLCIIKWRRTMSIYIGTHHHSMPQRMCGVLDPLWVPTMLGISVLATN